MKIALIAALGFGLTAAGAGFAQEEAETGTGAMLRGLDKVNGHVTDIELSNGESAKFGRLTVSLQECRFPVGDAAGDAYAFLRINEADGREVFAGWMLASSPALNAMEHSRYDVWVLRCKTE